MIRIIYRYNNRNSVQKYQPCDTFSNFQDKQKKVTLALKYTGLNINSVRNNFMMDSSIVDA